MDAAITELLDQAASSGLVLALTGAGISAESGIPTFRGPEGYWRVGSRNYQPEELATRSAFERMPDAIWSWYLYRRGVCRAAAPNAAHRALADLERALGERFVLVTQNVDGLHRRAGNARPLEIHGDIDFMRCSDEGCSAPIAPLPAAVPLEWPRDRALGEAESALLRCAECGAWTRPHVLWFDEYYDEERFRAESALAAARATSLLLVIGTAGQTNLPQQIVRLVASRGVPILQVNPEPTVFSPLATDLLGPATKWVPELVSRLSARGRT